MDGLKSGQRVKLVRNHGGFWMAHLFGPYYLDLNRQPTGTVVAITESREPAGDLVAVALDGHPAHGLIWPSSWGFAPGLLMPVTASEIRPAPICDGVGQPVAAETMHSDLLAHLETCDAWILLQPRERVLAALRGESHVIDRV